MIGPRSLKIARGQILSFEHKLFTFFPVDTSKPKIRIKQISSLEDLAKDLERLYLEAYRDDYLYAYREPKRVRRYLRWLIKHAQGGFWVALAGERPVGFLALQPDCRFQGEVVPEIHELVVDPEYQGQSVARKLMEEAFRFLEERGYSRVALWVGEKNEKAKHFYQNLGFEETSRQGAWIRMERPLHPQAAKMSSNLSNTRKASTTSGSRMVSSGV